jgi:hypothetical protein
MRVRGTLLVLGVSACASSNTLERPATTETVRVVGSGQPGGTISMGIVSSPGGTRESRIFAPIEKVWAALPAAYQSLGVPLTTSDVTTHVAGNIGLNVRRRLGSTPLVRYIDCGNSQMGPSADTYDVRLTVTTRLQADSVAGTKLSTLVEAVGRPVAFSGEYSRCSSLGVLEARLTDAVKAELQR